MKPAARATYPDSLTDYLRAEFEKTLAGIAGEREQYRFLILQWNVWQQRYGRFIAASVMDLGIGLPAEFNFGPYGHINAGDFIIVLGMIDAAKTKLERMREPA